MADDVEVKLGADVGDLKSNTADGASSVADSLAKIQSSMDALKAQSKKTSDDVNSHTQSIASAFLALKNSTSSSLDGLVAGIGRVRAAIVGISTILSGGLIGKEAIEAFTGMAESVRGLQITLGIGSEAATKLSVNLKLAGIEVGTFEQMVFRIGMRLRTSSEDFTKLGVSVRNSNGELLPTETILQNVYKRMLDFKPGADQMEFALTTVGRQAKDFAYDMELLNATNQRAGQLMEQLGIEMGGARQGEVRAYQVEFRAFKVTLDEVGVALGSAMLPSLEKLSAWLISVGPAVIKNVAVAFGILGDAIDIVVTIIKQLWANFLAVADAAEFAYNKLAKWGSLIPGIHGVGEEAKKVLDIYNRFSDLTSPTAWVQMLLGMKKSNQEAANKIVDDTTDMFRRLKLLTADYSQYENDAWSKIEKARAGASMGIPSSGKNLPMPDLSKGGPTQVEMWKQQLEQLKMAEGLFKEYSKAQEAEFWAVKLTLVKKGTKDYNDVYSLLYQARKAAANEELQDQLAAWQTQITAAQNNKDKQIAIAVERTAYIGSIYGTESKQYQSALNEELKLRQEWQKKEAEILKARTKIIEDAATAEVALEQENLNQQVSLREVSTQQKFAKEQEFEDRLYALKLKALNEEKATLDAGTLAYVQAEGKIEALEQAHQLKLTSIAHAAELDRRKDELQASQDFEQDFSSALASVIDGTKSLKNAFLDFFKSLDQQLSKIASDQIAKQLFGAGTGGGDFVSGIMGKIFGSGITGGGAAGAATDTAHTAAVTADTTATTALTTVSTTFSAALASATASLTAFSASLAAGGAGGGLGGIFGGSSFDSEGAGIGFGAIASLDVGTPYVPQDTLAIVHRGEAVIPASMNRAGSGARTSSVTQHFYISGNPDSRTIDQIHAAAARGANKATRSIM